MLRVRYPSGMVVDYGQANLVRSKADRWELFTGGSDDEGDKVAWIQLTAGCIIEALPPSRVVPPIQAGQLADLETRLQWAERELAATSAELRACVRSRAAYKGIVTWQKKQLEACICGNG